MNYSQIVKTIATKENCSPKEIENEMKKALALAGIGCSPKIFLKQTVLQLQQQIAK